MERGETSEHQSQASNGSPKIDRMFNTLKYYSPVKLANEEKLIEEIRSIGNTLIQEEEFQSDSQGKARRSKSLIPNYSFGNIFKSKLQKQSTKPLLGWGITLISTQSKQKQKQSGKMNQSESNLHHNNLYDKYASENKRKQFRTIANKTKEIVQDVKVRKHKQKDIPKVENANNNLKAGLNYEKFIKSKIQINIQAENKIKKMKNQQTINVFNGKAHKKHTIRNVGSPFEVQEALKNILSKSKQLQDRKMKKYLKIEEELRSKELKEAHFKPNLTKTAKYRCDQKKYVGVEPKVSNFMKRLNQNKIASFSKQKSIIQDQIEKLSFEPKLNNIENENYESKVKKYWSSTNSASEKKLSSTVLFSSRVQKIFQVKKQQSFDEKSMSSTLGVSLKNPNQLSFLFQ